MPWALGGKSLSLVKRRIGQQGIQIKSERNHHKNARSSLDLSQKEFREHGLHNGNQSRLPVRGDLLKNAGKRGP